MNQIQTHMSAKECAQEMGGACIAMRSRVINRVISRIYDEALRPHGIKGSQMSILAVISGFGRAEPSEICRLLQLDASTLSRNVSRMKSKGWLKAATRSDRRAHRLELTAEGERIIEEAFSSWQEAQDKVTNALGEENMAAIRKVARTLRARAVEL
jgi:DNA-binding MarR family transcriptional regulator